MQPDLTHQGIERSIAPTGQVERARDLLERMFDGTTRGLDVELADGSWLYRCGGSPRAVVVCRDLGALRALVLGPASIAAARAVIGGDLDVRGDVEYAIAQAEKVTDGLGGREMLSIAATALRLPSYRPSAGDESRVRRAFHGRGRKHSLDRDRAAISYHYDVSNDFYALWLDRELVYSCAYFKSGDESLDDAQLAKLDHICRKLRLRAGERLLDVGCGWGSLVRFAAREYGATCVGITLSRRQAEYASWRIAAEGLDRRCSVELRDYRQLGELEPFDKAASVGMVEHVGTGMLGVYFSAVFDALRPGGLFLNHGITSQRRAPTGAGALLERMFPKRSTFIERYVFPDGDLARLDQVLAAAEHSGFEIRDVENLREHYATTLRHWVRRLEAHEGEARAAVGDETYNVWRFYMAGSAHGFAIGRMGLDQTLLAKRDAAGVAEVPRTRADIYQPV